jgi:hypothetical protein
MAVECGAAVTWKSRASRARLPTPPTNPLFSIHHNELPQIPNHPEEATNMIEVSAISYPSKLVTTRRTTLFTMGVGKAHREAHHGANRNVSHRISRRVNCYFAKRILLTGSFPVDSSKPSPMEGFPMRSWSIRICLLNEQGEEIPATIFEKVTYKLHPTFTNPTPS